MSAVTFSREHARPLHSFMASSVVRKKAFRPCGQGAEAAGGKQLGRAACNRGMTHPARLRPHAQQP